MSLHLLTQAIQKQLSEDLQALVTSGNLTEEQARAMMAPSPPAHTPTPQPTAAPHQHPVPPTAAEPGMAYAPSPATAPAGPNQYAAATGYNPYQYPAHTLTPQPTTAPHQYPAAPIAAMAYAPLPSTTTPSTFSVPPGSSYSGAGAPSPCQYQANARCFLTHLTKEFKVIKQASHYFDPKFDKCYCSHCYTPQQPDVLDPHGPGKCAWTEL